MPLKEQDTKKIIEFVKKEPRTVQEISKFLKRSWVTTNTYLEQIKNLQKRLSSCFKISLLQPY